MAEQDSQDPRVQTAAADPQGSAVPDAASRDAGQDAAAQAEGDAEAERRSPGNYAVPLFFQRAMQARARAMGRSYASYRPPEHMTQRLRFIDRMAGEADGTLSTLHRSDDDADEESAVPEERERQHDAARYYEQAQQYIHARQRQGHSSAAIARNNLKVVGIIVAAVVAYYLSGALFHSPQPTDLAGFKAALPLQLDEATVIERAEETGDEFLMYIVKDSSHYAGLSRQDIAYKFEGMARSAPQQLCRIRIMNELVNVQGKKLTVSLSTDDQSISRVFSIEHCAVDLGTGQAEDNS